MRLGIISATIIILLLAGGSYFFFKHSAEPATNSETPEEMQAENKLVIENSETIGAKNTLASSEGSGSYLIYSKSNFDSSVDKKRVLFFYANWCETCRPADANFKANISKFPKNLVLLRVNYNDSDTDQEEKDLAKKYGITYQHTFVQVDNEGNEITKWNGGQTDKLLSSIK